MCTARAVIHIISAHRELAAESDGECARRYLYDKLGNFFGMAPTSEADADLSTERACFFRMHVRLRSSLVLCG